MGRFYPKRISDLLRVGAQLKITCNGCGRSGVYATLNVLDFFRGTGRIQRNQDWTIAGSYFRCEACRHRGATLDWVPPPEEKTPAPLIESRDQFKMRMRRESS